MFLSGVMIPLQYIRWIPENGSLEKVYTEPVSGGPASLAVHPSKQFLYVALRSANAISAYRIDPVYREVNSYQYGSCRR